MANMRKTDIIKMRIKRIEKEIRDTPYHKGTEHHIGRLRAKLSKLKSEILGDSGKKGGGGGGYAVKKQGDATVTLVGPPSVGKSTLLNKLTNAKSKIAPYAFTTVSVVPGMMQYQNAKIQILDVPGLIEGADSGKGRGKEVLSVVRGSDLLIIMCDAEETKSLATVTNSLETSGIRINKKPPLVDIEKDVKGGLKITSNINQDFGNETIKQVAKEFGITNGSITIREKLSLDELIDNLSKNRVYIPAIYAVNKIDKLKLSDKKLKSLNKEYTNICPISTKKNTNLYKLKNKIWKGLRFVRIYLVKKDESPNKNNPIIMKSGDTLYDVALKIGSEFADSKRKAKIWGTGAKFPGQEVSLKTQVKHDMQVKFI